MLNAFSNKYVCCNWWLISFFTYSSVQTQQRPLGFLQCYTCAQTFTNVAWDFTVNNKSSHHTVIYTIHIIVFTYIIVTRLLKLDNSLESKLIEPSDKFKCTFESRIFSLIAANLIWQRSRLWDAQPNTSFTQRSFRHLFSDLSSWNWLNLLAVYY